MAAVTICSDFGAQENSLSLFPLFLHLFAMKLWRRTKEPLDEGERGQWNAGLELNIQKMKITASRPITSWQIDGETMETVTEFIFLGSKITVDGDCSHEIKRYLLLGWKMTNLDTKLKAEALLCQQSLYT